MLFHSLHNAIVSVSSFVVTFEPLKARVFGNPQSNSVLDSKFLKLAYHAISDIGDTFAQKAVHTGLKDVEFVLYAEVDEVSIKE